MVYLIVLLLIIIADQFIKAIVMKNLKVEEKREIVKDKVYLWHKRNKGISYSSLSNMPNLVIKLTGVLTVAGTVSFLVLLTRKGLAIFKIAVAFIVGGGIGNYIDRIRHKSVTDYIYIKGKNTPIFNLADVFILLGSIIMLFMSFKDE
ncbi:MAG: signal peptidase II [Anaerotignaceae bacterium]